MTEEEAKTKWCPYARVVRASESGAVENGQGPMNRFDVPDRTKSPQTPLASNCIASACMAWRWRTIPNPAWNGATQMAMYPPANPYSQVPSGIPSATDGGCGLAGAPQ